MDDGSSDSTAEAVQRSLASLGFPSHYRLVVNAENLGLARTLNRAFGLARTPFALTCHLDCRFGSDDYVASMLDLIERHPRAAAITGQAAVAPGVLLPFAEKLNIIANLMDIFPNDSDSELTPVGFAEGRCDVFRVEALRAVGFYDTHLRASGEDQVLAARLRKKGYEIYQAPRLIYYLSISGEQDSVPKLMRHQWLFGRTDPYIVIAIRGSHAGLVGRRAGPNRRLRTLLRVTQLAASGTYVLVLVSLVGRWPGWLWGAALGVVTAAKAGLFLRHVRAMGLTPRELITLLFVQPLLDISFTVGLVQGFWYLARGGRSRPIR